MMGYLLGIGGKMNAGKTTVSSILLDNEQWTRIRFAGPFKSLIEYFLALNGYPEHIRRAIVDGALKNVHLIDIGLSGRKIMQLIGSEFREYINHANLWRDMALYRADTLRKSKNVAIDDLRFTHEIDGILDHGGRIWLVEGIQRPIRGADFNLIEEVKAYDKRIDDHLFISRLEESWIQTVGRSAFIKKIGIDSQDFVLFAKEFILPLRNQSESLSPNISLHASEQSLPDRNGFDYTITNDSDMDNLRRQVTIALASLDLNKTV